MPWHEHDPVQPLDAPGAELLASPAPLRTLPVPDVRLQRAPTAAGVQSALVTGDGAAVHTDRDARVRLQFHWQRGHGSSHRLPHPDGGSNAPANAASFPWVRVGQAHAGRNHGALFLPRVGQEVLVAFIGGDVERPVVLGGLYNGRGQPNAAGNRIVNGPVGATGSAPAWFAGTARTGGHEGHQHPAVLMGHRSQALDSSATGRGGFTQLVFDDSAQGGRIELAASTAATRLQLGVLRQQEGNERLAPRGHGLDLASQSHGALRAGAGLLLSAHAQPDSTGAGQQMDSRAPLELLRQAQERLHTLATSAQAQGARLPDELSVASATPQPPGRPLPVEQGLQALQDSLQATAGNTGGDWGDEATRGGGLGTVAAWQRPELVLAAPAGIGLFTPANAFFSAGASATFVAGQDLNVMAQGNHVLAARCGVVLYTFGQAASQSKPNAETGIAIHAAAGSVHASANTGAARLAARTDVEVASTQGSVEVGSPLSLLLAAAGAALKIDGNGIEVTAPGSVRFRAGMKNLTGGANASMPGLHLPAPPEIHLDPEGPFSLRFAMQGADDMATDASLCGLPYRACTRDGSVITEGTVPENGRIPRIETERREEIFLEIGDTEVAQLICMGPTPLAVEYLETTAAESTSDSVCKDEEFIGEREDEEPSIVAEAEPETRYEADLAAALDRQYGHFLPQTLIAVLIEEEESRTS
jgi:type VI secretion system secreted protein VgrG